MGANSSKNGRASHPRLSETEYSRLDTFYKTACDKHQHLTENDLVSLWKELAEESLLEFLIKYLYNAEKSISFSTFIGPYVTVIHGTSEEKARLLCTIIAGDPSAAEVPVVAVTDYVERIISSYALQMKTFNNKELLSWEAEKFRVRGEDVKLFASSLCHDLPRTSNVISLEVLEKWVSTWSRLAALEKLVFRNLYNVGPDEAEEGSREVKFIPRCVMLPRLSAHPSILDMSNVIALNSALPAELRDQWRLLFSTTVHGESFSKLMECITKRGPTLLVIEDKGQHVFGGFAPHSWKLSPNFAGDDTSFLFTLRPAVNTYFPSSYNNHYQYINTNQQTFPNGLGMGGQFEYFALWLDAEFGEGHSSQTCTTYKDYKMLSSSKVFHVNHVEAWGVGPEPRKKSDEEEGTRSVLDSETEAKALLELAGKTAHSDGYREPVEENY